MVLTFVRPDLSSYEFQNKVVNSEYGRYLKVCDRDSLNYETSLLCLQISFLIMDVNTKKLRLNC